MVKIDRLGWAGGFAVEGYGVTVGVRATNHLVLRSLRTAVPFGVRRSRRRRVDYLYSVVVGSLDDQVRPRRFHLAWADLGRLIRTTDFDQVVEAIKHDMPLVIGARARGWVFVHAGVVGWGGQGLVLPGQSFSGKSTLVEALVRAGASYYSDEFAILDEQGYVHPYPRPLALRQGGEFKGRPVPIAELGGVVGETPLPVAAVVFARYQEGATLRLRSLSPGQGVLGLMENAVAARTRTEAVLPVLVRVSRGACFLAGVRGEAKGAVERLLRLVDGERRCASRGG